MFVIAQNPKGCRDFGVNSKIIAIGYETYEMAEQMAASNAHLHKNATLIVAEVKPLSVVEYRLPKVTNL